MIEQLRLYLDTGVLIGLMDVNDPHHQECAPLAVAAQAGRVILLWSTGADYDLETAEAARRAERLSWLHQCPWMTKAPAPFVLDVSILDGGDVLVGDDNADRMKSLQRLLGWKQQPHDTDERSRRRNLDLHHVYAAVLQGAVLVTLDEDDLWKKRDAIFREAGLRVVRPSEVLDLS